MSSALPSFIAIPANDSVAVLLPAFGSSRPFTLHEGTFFSKLHFSDVPPAMTLEHSEKPFHISKQMYWWAMKCFSTLHCFITDTKDFVPNFTSWILPLESGHLNVTDI